MLPRGPCEHYTVQASYCRTEYHPKKNPFQIRPENSFKFNFLSNVTKNQRRHSQMTVSLSNSLFTFQKQQNFSSAYIIQFRNKQYQREFKQIIPQIVH